MTDEMFITFWIIDKICSGLGAVAACFLIYRYYIQRHTERKTKLILIIICMLASLGNYSSYWVNINGFSNDVLTYYGSSYFGVGSIVGTILRGSIYIAGISSFLFMILWLLENIKDRFFEKQRLWMIRCTVLIVVMFVIHLIFVLMFLSKIPRIGLVRYGYVVNLLMYAAFSALVFAAAMRDYNILQDKA